jgi:polysaccharide pyruvyl transferase WcaK-like protein
MSPPGSFESDVEACTKLLAALPTELGSRMRITSTELDEREVKWLISKLDWFCGTRMHSTIAALSSRVPTVAVAYSDKTRGVFETCAVDDQVIDPRQLQTRDVIERLNACWERRDETASVLSSSIERVKERATEQLTEIFRNLKQGSSSHPICEQARG